MKTGGLADVVAALPAAQAQQRAQVRLLLPGLPAVLDGVPSLRTVLEVGSAFGALRVRLLRGRLPGSGVAAYVIDAPYLYRRDGNPYLGPRGEPWHDNLQRFALLGRMAAHLAVGDADPAWRPAIVHAHDWHAAMACAYLHDHGASGATSVFTVHNLAFQGLFPLADGALLGLGARYLTPPALEFHGSLSFMKAGLKFADRITTVSPTYAREIATHEFGCGLEGVIRGRGDAVSGILNGIDADLWNPATDPALAAPYGPGDMDGKRACRRALQREAGLDEDDDALVAVVVSRLTEQKGIDLLMQAWPELIAAGVQIVVQGTGDPASEAALHARAAAVPGRARAFIGYDEQRAHRLIAGGDVILVPSRFEPCGLTQMYGLRYGTLPVVRAVGGLADTVFDAGRPVAAAASERGHGDAAGPFAPHPAAGAAAASVRGCAGEGTPGRAAVPAPNGFTFHEASAAALVEAVRAAAHARRDAVRWRALCDEAMRTELSWERPARDYLALYRAAARGRPA